MDLPSGLMDLPSTPYFLYLHYFGLVVAHSHFSTSHTAHGFATSLFPSSFRPIYFLKAHLFISWACDPLFLPLGLNSFSIHSLTLFCSCCWASSFYWASQNGHQQRGNWERLCGREVRFPCTHISTPKVQNYENVSWLSGFLLSSFSFMGKTWFNKMIWKKSFEQNDKPISQTQNTEK